MSYSFEIEEGNEVTDRRIEDWRQILQKQASTSGLAGAYFLADEYNAMEKFLEIAWEFIETHQQCD